MRLLRTTKQNNGGHKMRQCHEWLTVARFLYLDERAVLCSQSLGGQKQDRMVVRAMRKTSGNGGKALVVGSGSCGVRKEAEQGIACVEEES